MIVLDILINSIDFYINFVDLSVNNALGFTMNEILEQIFERARIKKMSQAELAYRAGLRPETLSRLKERNTCNLKTLQALALAVGYRLALAPLEQQGDSLAYSPGAVARQKAEARLRDEETIAAGRASPRQVQRRNAMTGLRRAKFPLKGLPGKR
jgi:hypothetical protein